jgi:hypothetical protein
VRVPFAIHLADIRQDPGEKNNLADQYPEVVAGLKAEFDQWWESTGPSLVNEGLPNIPPEAQPFNKRYEAQLSKQGIPFWTPKSLKAPVKKSSNSPRLLRKGKQPDR